MCLIWEIYMLEVFSCIIRVLYLLVLFILREEMIENNFLKWFNFGRIFLVLNFFLEDVIYFGK